MIIKKIFNILKQYKSLKVNVILYGKFRAIVDGKIIEDVKHFQTANEIILEWFDKKIEVQLLVMVEEFEQEKSDRSLIEIINQLLNINKYTPISIGLSTYTSFPNIFKIRKL